MMSDQPPSEPTRPLNVLFIHPSYPNTFHNVLETLARRPGLRCACMVENRWRSAVRADQPRLMYFGFDVPDSGTSLQDPYLASVQHWMSCGHAVAVALQGLAPRHNFDVIIVSATSGCALYLRKAVQSGIISYCEQPRYAMWAARKEFPPTFENDLYDITYQSMILTSVIHSDLGLVASEYARNLFPPELQPKVRVQSEAFVVPPAPGDVREVREKMGLPIDKPLIGFFGRSLEAVRGFDIFLQVAQRIRQARPDVQFLIIGQEQTRYGNELTYLNEISFKQYALDRAGLAERDLIWRDWLPYEQFLDYLACLDLAILPTFDGASNWSFFEGMAAAVPILSSNQSYIPELMRDGKEGYLFDPYDVDGFTGKALELLDKPEARQRIGQRARQRIQQQYTPEPVADGYERIIHEAHSRNRERLGHSAPGNGSS